MIVLFFICVDGQKPSFQKFCPRSWWPVCPVWSAASSDSLQSVNPYLQGQRLDKVVAKKSVPHFSEEEEEEDVSKSSAAIKPVNWSVRTSQTEFLTLNINDLVNILLTQL